MAAGTTPAAREGVAPTASDRAGDPSRASLAARKARSAALPAVCACRRNASPAAADSDPRRQTVTNVRHVVSGPDTFTDVFLLVLVNSEWQIANKAYHRH